MINNLRTARQENGGFTLVELLIVIVVLGVLAGITVFGVANFKDNATKAACQANLKTVQVAADAFNAQTGAYPTAITDLTGGTVEDPLPVYIKSAPATPTNLAFTTTGVTGTCS